MLISIYQLKPKFQALLRPFASQLYSMKITANRLTIFTLLASATISLIVWLFWEHQEIFFIIPIFMLIRMALNALDGMLAREFNQKSDLGAYLNELCDIVSDTVLYLVFVFIANTMLVISVIILSIISEYAGVLGVSIGASRRYDGPMGKSDRAFVFGVFGIMIGANIFIIAINYMLIMVILLLAYTIFNRVKNGLKESGVKI